MLLPYHIAANTVKIGAANEKAAIFRGLTIFINLKVANESRLSINRDAP